MTKLEQSEKINKITLNTINKIENTSENYFFEVISADVSMTKIKEALEVFSIDFQKLANEVAENNWEEK